MLVLDRFARAAIRSGSLVVIDPRGRRHRYGDGSPPVVIRIHDPVVSRRMLTRGPSLAVGEAWMDGALSVEEGGLYDLLDLCLRNAARHGPVDTHWMASLARLGGRLVRVFRQFNPATTARRNVAHHYDLGDRLYELFLDRDRQYSCAYFLDPADDIDRAQEQKKRHIAAKLCLEPGHRVLDIGSGWGGLGLYLASVADCDVTGLTLSQAQFETSNRRATEMGLAGRVRFRLQDYRREIGRYDRVVSVGMFEHVGVVHYRAFFRRLRAILDDERGVAVLHTIGRSDGPASTDPWIRKYIFPGGYSPALSEMLPHIERCGLYVTDIEILRLHYAQTLRLWRERFERNREAIRELFDDRFCRMWEFYLTGSELAFRRSNHVVFQIQLATRQDTVPLTRDYVEAFERAHPIGEESRSGILGAQA